MNNTLRVLQIVPGTSVDGPGLRTSIYLAGCNHRCPGCHNPASWDFNSGREMTVDEIAEIALCHGFHVTLTGGDPLQSPNLPALMRLTEILKENGLRVWCYTGYTFEELSEIDSLRTLIAEFEAIVEGPFIAAERDSSLRFRGSRNQRILHPDGTPYPLD